MTSNELKMIHQLGKGYFPESIPIFKVRHDRKGHELTRGDVHHKLHTESNNTDPFKPSPKSSTYQHFVNALQCAVHEPDFNDINGAINLLRMVPPSIESLEYCCTYAETRCPSHSKQLLSCAQLMASFKNGNHPESLGVYQHQFNGFEQMVLMRVYNNVLYYDWPWGRDRIHEYQDAHNDGSTLQPVINENYKLMIDTLHLVNVDDSVFMMGAEQPSLPWLLPPFPSFSFAPKLTNSEMPWPWPESYRSELDIYRQVASLNHKVYGIYDDASFNTATKQLPWDQRINKAAFFSSYNVMRHVVWDQAVLRPDLIDAPLYVYPGFTFWNAVPSWNAKSQEPTINSFDELQALAKQVNRTEPGYVSFLANITQNNTTPYIPGYYKYVVVVGITASTTGRLAQLLAHSGAVVLLHKTAFVYHFSARLVPWVHYVPLAYSSADLIEKIEWLRANDGLARQLAENARNFGKSFLRLEDYYCYAAAALHLVADVEKVHSNVTHLFNVSYPRVRIFNLPTPTNFTIASNQSSPSSSPGVGIRGGIGGEGDGRPLIPPHLKILGGALAVVSLVAIVVKLFS